METSGWLVFVVGSLLSYVPIYWALRRWSGRRQPKRIRRPKTSVGGDARRQFVDYLRQEAMTRLEVVLEVVLAETRAPKTPDVKAGTLDREALTRLSDMRRTLQVLFSRDALLAFDDVVRLLHKQPHSGVDLSKFVAKLRAKLMDQIENHPPVVSRGGPSLGGVAIPN